MTDITIRDAQRDVRTVFRHGSIGQLVSGVIWLAAALAASAGSVRWAVLLVVVGGAFIFPLTQLGLRLLGGPHALRRDHPMNALAMQVAFTVPLVLPVAGAAALYRIEWFFPAVMVILGAHYLPFVFLYGMPSFAVLGGGLIGAGVLIALQAGRAFALGAWVTAFALLAFGVWAALGSRARRAVAALSALVLILP